MQCQKCKKNTATIHLTEITDGVREETHLCELCAHKQGIAIKSQMPLNEFLNTLLAVQPETEEATSAETAELVCPQCGITWEQFRKKGLLGCPHDYEVFEDVLSTIIEQTHAGNSTHCGKVPSSTGADTKKQTQLLRLRRDLDAAVRQEDYEAAAKLRDRIQELE